MKIMKVLAILSAALILPSQLFSVNSQQIHSIRLTGGSNLYNGEVEVLYCANTSTCTWKPLCWKDWTDTEAVIACNQLGLNDSNSSVNYSAGDRQYYVRDAVDIRCGHNITNESMSLNECSVMPCEHYYYYYYVSSTALTCARTLEAPILDVSNSNVSAMINWMIPGGTATKYYVSCTNGYHSHSHNESSVYLSELKPYTNYTCCVSGVDSNNVVGLDNCTRFQTLVGDPSAAPSNLRYTELQSHNMIVLLLQWNELRDSERAGPQNWYSLNVSAVRSGSTGCTHPQTMQRNIEETHTNITVCPGTTYSISVRACNSDCGQNSTLQVQTPEGAPSMVGSLMCSMLSFTQMRVTWDAPMTPNGVIRYYEVVLRNSSTGENITTQLVDGQTTTATISHLQPNTPYNCSVRAHTTVPGSFYEITSDRLSQPSVPVHFNCNAHNDTTLVVILLNISDLLVSELGEQLQYCSVTLWDAGTNEVVYSEEIRSPIQRKRLYVTPPSQYNNYMCSVAAYSQYNMGLFGVIPVWIPHSEKFGPPLNVECTVKTSRSCNVSWRSPRINTRYNNTQIQNYTVRVYSNESSEWDEIFTHNIHESKLNFLVEGLHPNYYFRINVSATATEGGESNQSTLLIKTSEEKPSGPPLNLIPSNITRSSFNLNWTEPRLENQNGHITGYRIKVVDTGNIQQSFEIDTTKIQAMVVPVEESTTFNVTVAAMTSVGIGPYSEPIILTTLSGRPSVDLIALYSTSSLLVLVIVILLGVLFYFRVKYHVSRKKSGRSHLRRRIATGEGSSRSPNDRYNTRTTFTDEEKNVKPPAVPPKTYLEEEEDEDKEDDATSKTSCPSDDDAHRPDYDNCSIDSDSLCNMKLDSMDDLGLKQKSATGDHDTKVDASDTATQPFRAQYTFNDKKKNVKPPALLPKTYLEEEEEDVASQTSCPSDKDVHRPDYENCSIGSDSLYDMKLDIEDDLKLPQRISATGDEKADPRNTGAQSSRAHYTSITKQLPPSSVTAHPSYDDDTQNPESHYQRLDMKAMNRPSNYEDINLVRLQKEMFVLSRSATGQRKKAGSTSHYESLQLKNLNKPSEYQWTTLK